MSNYENGYSAPSNETLVALAVTLDVDYIRALIDRNCISNQCE
ncbi:helix-turn-helix domain-containing protein [Paenibacillus sp. BJ-4]|nr:helix-turn-helix transcriptional regulator [Paenibacillus sp. BJ-4]